VDASLNGFASAEIVKLQKQIEHIQAKLIKQQKAKFDGDYASKISFGFEVLILFKTILYFTRKPPTY
jgi:lipopolysaccharide/colanic/teichoic acid biosynthesis glycosyltransferase